LKLDAGLSSTRGLPSSPVGDPDGIPGDGTRRDMAEHRAIYGQIVVRGRAGADVSPQRFPGTPRSQEGRSSWKFWSVGVRHDHAALPLRSGGCPCGFPPRKKKISLNRCRLAQELIYQYACECKVNVVFISEAYQQQAY
jgi:hypothetical protein